MKKRIITLVTLAFLTLGSFGYSMSGNTSVNEYGLCGSGSCCGQCQM